MTPNQARAIPASVARLLESGERQGLRPEREIVEVTHSLTMDDQRVFVFTYWTEPEGSAVMLSETIDPDGTVTPRDARWQDDESPLREEPPQPLSADPFNRAGVRYQGINAYYSAAWLSSDPDC